MNRRSFLKSFFVVAGVATVAPEMLLSKPDLRQIDFSITEEIGALYYNPMAVEQMASAFASIQRHDLGVNYMFVHPQVYKEWCPEGYAKMVAMDEEAADVPSSSNGRTVDFESTNRGSNPRDGAKQKSFFETWSETNNSVVL